MNHTIKCNECMIRYPDDSMHVTHLMMNGKYYQVCGICALQLTNDFHGINRTKFDGEQAEFVRENCIEFRKKLKNDTTK